MKELRQLILLIFVKIFSTSEGQPFVENNTEMFTLSVWRWFGGMAL